MIILSPAAVPLQKRREGVDGRRIFAVGDIDDLATSHVYEQADVVVAPTRGRLVCRDLFDLAEIRPFNRLQKRVMIEGTRHRRVSCSSTISATFATGIAPTIGRKRRSLEQQREA